MTERLVGFGAPGCETNNFDHLLLVEASEMMSPRPRPMFVRLCVVMVSDRTVALAPPPAALAKHARRRSRPRPARSRDGRPAGAQALGNGPGGRRRYRRRPDRWPRR